MRRHLPRCTTTLLLAAVALFLANTAPAAQPISETVPDVGRYELYVPFQKEGEEAPLLVWLHPAGGYANQLVTRWWPDLHELGYALMLPRSKTERHWGLNEDKTLYAYIDHAAKKHPVDPERVVLLGYSAGGQLAFHMGMTRPERLAGIVTMAAVPVKGPRDLSTALPDKKHKDSLAYFMVLGEQERGAVRIAQRAQLELLADGFSAVLHVIEGAGHTFHEAEKKNILAWLGEVAEGKRPAADEIRELAKEAPERIRAYREEQERLRKLHEKRVEVAGRVFDQIKQNAGKPYTLDWQPAGKVTQGGPVRIHLPKGWSVGDTARNGESSAIPLTPPGDAHIVAYLGRSVKKEGLQAHYRKWLRKMAKDNRMVAAKGATLPFNGRQWHLYTFFVVPYDKAHEPEARRVLIMALHPLSAEGTEWRSVTVMCPEQDCKDNAIAEIIRGLLEKTEFGPPAGKGG
jgi:predicted esterase